MLDKGDFDSYTAIGKRVNLQSVSQSLRRDGELLGIRRLTYKEREAVAYNRAVKKLSELGKDEGEIEKIMEAVTPYVGEMEDINFSLGMKAGARLQLQMLCNFEKDFL